MLLHLKFIDSRDEEVSVRSWLKGDVTTSLGVWVLEKKTGVFELAGVGKVSVRDSGQIVFEPKDGMNEARVLAEFGRTLYLYYAPKDKALSMEVSLFERL